jgi:hypothetical protein
MKQKFIPGLVVGILMLVQLACSAAAPQGTPDTVATLNGLYTAAAQTSTAFVQPNLTSTPGLPLPTASPLQPLPSSTPFVFPTYTAQPVVRCDAAAFVKDVTVGDGSVLTRGATFTKTWRLKNVGSCSWNSSYALVFINGDAMSGPTTVSLGGTVQPGQTIDVSATMVAPSSDGHYRGYWKLRNASNALFGIGKQADTAFWVDIYVKGPVHTAYDFAEEYCEADWENNNGALPCPGTQDDDAGYVVRLDAPRMENGNKSKEPGLLTFPKRKNNGFISGTYPALIIKSGDHFRAWITCKYNATGCNVTFKLQFRSSGQVWTLGTWREVYEGKYYPVDVDLSTLAGRQGKIILTVLSNGDSTDDEALWIAPKLIRY